jgi:hypothetical protein
MASKEDEIFIPVINKYAFFNKIYQGLIEKNKETITIACPLPITGSGEKCTGTSIIEYLLKTRVNKGLTEVTTKRGDVFYGGAGILLNSRKDILIIFGYTSKIVNNKIKLTGIKGYISPLVFLSNDIVCKAIIKNVIPCVSTNLIATHKSNFPYGKYDADEIGTYETPKLLIQDLSYLTSSPIVPNNYPVNFTDRNAKIWDFIDNYNIPEKFLEI